MKGKMARKRPTTRHVIAKLVCTNNRPTTPLFEAIVTCAWMDVDIFLNTGVWDKYYGDSTDPAHIQAQQETTYFDTYIQERITQLPLHAAIFHLAPLAIVQQLAYLYPYALRVPDNKGNLPLHIAFMTNVKDVSSFLLKEYPDAMMRSNVEGNLPIDCSHDVFVTLGQSPMDLAADRDQKELQRLELEVARDKQRMNIAEMELQDLRNSFQLIQKHGQQMRQRQSASIMKRDYIEL
jgi:ankyrin repeat protein